MLAKGRPSGSRVELSKLRVNYQSYRKLRSRGIYYHYHYYYYHYYYYYYYSLWYHSRGMFVRKGFGPLKSDEINKGQRHHESKLHGIEMLCIIS